MLRDYLRCPIQLRLVLILISIYGTFFASAPSQAREFLAADQILVAIATDLETVAPHRRPNVRYISFANLYNAGHSKAQLDKFKSGASTALNLVSSNTEPAVFNSVEGTEDTVLRLHLKDLDWTHYQWSMLSREYPYAGWPSNNGASEKLLVKVASLRNNDESEELHPIYLSSDEILFRADWLSRTVLSSGRYEFLLALSLDVWDTHKSGPFPLTKAGEIEHRPSRTSCFPQNYKNSLSKFTELHENGHYFGAPANFRELSISVNKWPMFEPTLALIREYATLNSSKLPTGNTKSKVSTSFWLKNNETVVDLEPKTTGISGYGIKMFECEFPKIAKELGWIHTNKSIRIGFGRRGELCPE